MDGRQSPGSCLTRGLLPDETGRVHGRAAAVLMDVAAYEELVEELELLRDVHQAEKELAAGKGVAHSKARAQVLARLRG